MARMTKEAKRIEKEVSAALKRLTNGVQINIMDLGKISDAGTKAGEQGQDIDAAVAAAIQQYRQN